MHAPTASCQVDVRKMSGEVDQQRAKQFFFFAFLKVTLKKFPMKNYNKIKNNFTVYKPRDASYCSKQ